MKNNLILNQFFDEKDGFKGDARDLIALGEIVDRNLCADQARRFESSFGQPLAYLIAHPEIVEVFADDPDPDCRSRVLEYFAVYGPSPAAAHARLVAAIRTDPSTSVRSCAASTLGILSFKTGDPAFFHTLKEVARDEGQDDEVRKTAYFAVSFFDREENLMDFDRFDFPADVDWEYFNQLSEHPHAGPPLR